MKRTLIVAMFVTAALASIATSMTPTTPTLVKPAQLAVVPDPATIEEMEIKFAEASTILKAALGSHPKDFFGPRKTIDNDWTTCWSEGKDGFGREEWIKLVWLTKQTPAYIAVLPGWAKNKVRWTNNSRLKTAEVLLSNGYRTQATFEDRMQMQFVKLETSEPSEWVKISILTVYDGAKFQDTSISEIKVFKLKPKET